MRDLHGTGVVGKMLKNCDFYGIPQEMVIYLQ